MSNSNGVITPTSKVTVLKVQVKDFGDRKSQFAVLKQEFETKYPSGQNNLQDSIIDASEFESNTEPIKSTRHALYPLPLNWGQAERATSMEAGVAKAKEMFEGKLVNFPDARIYRIMSSDVNDVLSTSQKEMIAQGKSTKTLAEYQESEATKYGDSHENAGQKILHNGAPQYRGLFFSSTATEDIDEREQADEATRSTQRTEIAVSTQTVDEPVSANVGTEAGM
jgi:hypothetical protein